MRASRTAHWRSVSSRASSRSIGFTPENYYASVQNQTRVLGTSMTTNQLRFACQFKYRNLRSGAEPDGEAGGSKTTVHVELRATVFVQTPDVGYPHQAAEVEPVVDEIERQLAAAVNVAGQCQVD